MRIKAPTVRPNRWQALANRQWKKPLAHGVSFLWLLLGFAALGWGAVGLFKELERKAPLAIIQVEGDISPADREQLAAQLQQVVKGSYFTTDLQAIRDTVLATPWVESLSVQRRWPDGIRVLVIEKKPVARWGDNRYLSARGEIFVPKQGSAPEGLPMLLGPLGKANYVMEQYRSFNERLRPVHQQVVELHLTERMTWFMRLNSGIQLTLDQTQINEKMQRFLWLYQQQLQPYSDHIASIDLRYRNGLAVAWKEGLAVPVVNNQLKQPEQGLSQDVR